MGVSFEEQSLRRMARRRRLNPSPTCTPQGSCGEVPTLAPTPAVGEVPVLAPTLEVVEPAAAVDPVLATFEPAAALPPSEQIAAIQATGVIDPALAAPIPVPAATAADAHQGAVQADAIPVTEQCESGCRPAKAIVGFVLISVALCGAYKLLKFLKRKFWDEKIVIQPNEEMTWLGAGTVGAAFGAAGMHDYINGDGTGLSLPTWDSMSTAWYNPLTWGMVALELAGIIMFFIWWKGCVCEKCRCRHLK